MEDVKSGKELCDEFFKRLVERADIDSEVVSLVRDLYETVNLTTTRLRTGLRSLRQGNQNDQQN
jgi:hypothetical protein